MVLSGEWRRHLRCLSDSFAKNVVLFQDPSQPSSHWSSPLRFCGSLEEARGSALGVGAPGQAATGCGNTPSLNTWRFRPRGAPGPASPLPTAALGSAPPLYLSHSTCCPLCWDTCPWPASTTTSLSSNVPSYSHLPKKMVLMKSQPSRRGNLLHRLAMVSNLGNKFFHSADCILLDHW